MSRITARPGLVTPEELAEMPRHGLEPLVIDLRKNPADGRPKVPGSRWMDLHEGFAMRRPERRLEYDLPAPEEMAAALSRIGATPKRAMVFLDDMGNRWATRAYWVLRYY